MPFASINSTNPRTSPWEFHEKILRIGGAGKWGFFEAAILNFLSRPFWIFFCFISVKNPALLYEVSFFSALWMVFPESWKRSCPNFYANDCKLQRISNVTIKKKFYRCNHMRFCRRFLSLGSRIYRRGIRILFFTRYFRRFGKNWRRRAGRITPRHDGEFLLKQSDFC